MDSPRWLTRPEDIQAHLIYASSEIPSAVLTVANLQVHGRIAPPEEDSGQVAFIVDSSLDGLVNPPPPGRALKVEYEGNEDAFTFFSEMVGTDLLKRWVIAAPRTVERTNQRLVARHVVAGNSEFAITSALRSDLDELRVALTRQLTDLSQQQVESATVETPQKCEAPEHHQGCALQHDQTLTAATG